MRDWLVHIRLRPITLWRVACVAGMTGFGLNGAALAWPCGPESCMIAM